MSRTVWIILIALAWICPIIFIVPAMMGFAFLICAPLYGLIYVLNHLGFHYIWLHFGLIGIMGYISVVVLALYGILVWLRNI